MSAAATRRLYLSRCHVAHQVQSDGAALCGAAEHRGYRWLGNEAGRDRARLAVLSDCSRCTRAAEIARQVAAWDGPPSAPGVVALVCMRGTWRKVAACAACEQVRPMCGPGPVLHVQAAVRG